MTPASSQSRRATVTLLLLGWFYCAVRLFWLALLVYLVAVRPFMGDRYWLAFVAAYAFAACPLFLALVWRRFVTKRSAG